MIAIPVFFDVAFIIMIPVLHALSRKMAKPLLYFALPLLAGLAITHSFVPPTPGPVAVADILKADLGWVILFGLITGIPTALVCGLWLSKHLTKHLVYTAEPDTDDAPKQTIDTGLVKCILTLIALPVIMILAGTVCTTLLKTGTRHMVGSNIDLRWPSVCGIDHHYFTDNVFCRHPAWNEQRNIV